MIAQALLTEEEGSRVKLHSNNSRLKYPHRKLFQITRHRLLHTWEQVADSY